MGLLADFIVATRAEATEYAASGGSSDGLDRVEYKNYLPLSISELWANLNGEQLDFDRHDLEKISGDDGQTWLFRFPDELCSAIASIKSGEISRIAAEWSASEEVPGDPEDNVFFLSDLVKLCELAISKQRGVFLWGSL